MKKLLTLALFLFCFSIFALQARPVQAGASAGGGEPVYPIPPYLEQCTLIGCFEGTEWVDAKHGAGMAGFNKLNEGGMVQTGNGTHYLPNDPDLSDDAQYTKNPKNKEAGALLTGKYCVYRCGNTLVYVWTDVVEWNSEG